MKRLSIVILSVGMLIGGCTSSVKKNIQDAEDDKRELNEEYKVEVVTPDDASALDDVPVNPKIVRPDIVDDKASIDIYKNESQFIEVQFSAMGYKRISATLTSHDPQANIRFSRIIFPNDESDGPFGRELNYSLPMDGNYKLEIGSDMMAGEPWSGTFTVDFELFYDE